MTQPSKICPACQQPAPLDAQFCLRCGHGFRTQFVPQQTMMQFPDRYPVGRPKRAWIWALPIVTLAFIALCIFLFRPGPVLTGTWVNRGGYETYRFTPEGHVEHIRQWPVDSDGQGRTDRISGKWYVEQEAYTKDGTLMGILMLRSEEDSLDAVPQRFALSADAKHLRFIGERGYYEDFYRK